MTMLLRSALSHCDSGDHDAGTELACKIDSDVSFGENEWLIHLAEVF